MVKQEYFLMNKSQTMKTSEIKQAKSEIFAPCQTEKEYFAKLAKYFLKDNCQNCHLCRNLSQLDLSFHPAAVKVIKVTG